jgi:MraZ protein
MRFVGTFDYALDDRNRVPIPPAYRSAFEEGGYLATGTEKCLVIHTPDSFTRAAELIEAIPEETQEGEDARRDFYGKVWPLQKDGQGRILIKEELLKFAGLVKEVKVVGVGRRLEVWDSAAYDARESDRQAARISAIKKSQEG